MRRAGISQADLAKSVGVDQCTVSRVLSRINKGERTQTADRVWAELAKRLA